MALQNRVSPDGELHANNARGMFTGNRGIIHDPETKQLLGRRWSTNAWICCSLEWKGRKRDVWGKNYRTRNGTLAAGWSELFFLDEVIALAAGHRPCHTCRSSDAKRFHDAFCKGNGSASAGEKNRILHNQRWHSTKSKPANIRIDELRELPDGTVLKTGAGFYALKHHKLLPWRFEGYGTPVLPNSFVNTDIQCVTPEAIVETLRHGYKPLWHPTSLENG